MRNLSITCALLVSTLLAAPSGDKIVSGEATVQYNKDTTTVEQISATAIIEWKQFSLDQMESVTFAQPTGSSSVLNRVVGTFSSDIQGHLKANGNVYLINPNGVLIGSTGVINTGGTFLASTLDVSNEDFLAGSDLPFSGDSTATVVNLGHITSREGDIFLIAQDISNKGDLNSPSGAAGLGAASEILLKAAGDQRIFVKASKGSGVVNEGDISAVAAELRASGNNMYALAIQQTGTIRAGGLKNQEGRIVLCAEVGKTVVLGDMEAAAGEIDILGDVINLKNGTKISTSSKESGGKILVGGGLKGSDPQMKNAKNLIVGRGVVFSADALITGNGGTVGLWGDNLNIYKGAITAQGGQFSGDGGFVEISSPKGLKYLGTVSTTAPNGKTGQLLLDPSDILIDDFGGTSYPSFPTTPPGTYNPSDTFALLDVSTISSALESNNVSILTSAASGGSGYVYLDGDISWSAPTTLQIIADTSISFGGDNTITSSYSGNATPWTAMDFRANQSGSSGGNDNDGIEFNESTFLTSEGGISVYGNGGNSGLCYGIYGAQATITSTATGSVAGPLIFVGGSGVGSAEGSGGVQFDGMIISTVDSSIVITGTAQASGGDSIGTYIEASSSIAATGNGSVIINGTGGTVGDGNYGAALDMSTLSTNNGPITINGSAPSPGDSCFGISLQDVTVISTTGSAGTISFNGISGGDTSAIGIYTSITMITANNAPVSFTGTSAGVVAGNDGIYFSDSSTISTPYPLNFVGSAGSSSFPVHFGGDSTYLYAPSVTANGPVGID